MAHPLFSPAPSKVIEKDQATMDHLKESVGSNVLFQHLESDELGDVLDAMFPVNPKAGDVIIQQGDEGMATFQSFWTYAHAVSKRCTAPHAPCAMPKKTKKKPSSHACMLITRCRLWCLQCDNMTDSRRFRR